MAKRTRAEIVYHGKDLKILARRISSEQLKQKDLVLKIGGRSERTMQSIIRASKTRNSEEHGGQPEPYHPHGRDNLAKSIKQDLDILKKKEKH